LEIETYNRAREHEDWDQQHQEILLAKSPGSAFSFLRRRIDQQGQFGFDRACHSMVPSQTRKRRKNPAGQV
jgi:hypothetical protein